MLGVFETGAVLKQAVNVKAISRPVSRTETDLGPASLVKRDILINQIMVIQHGKYQEHAKPISEIIRSLNFRCVIEALDLSGGLGLEEELNWNSRPIKLAIIRNSYSIDTSALESVCSPPARTPMARRGRTSVN
jgi:hypothetical protein